MKRASRRKTRGKMSNGSRNLILLGLISTVIAMMTTGISLAIYHNSGDIYLDRSRPGYLPDEEEIEQVENEPEESEYEFNKDTQLTDAVIDEFLKEMKEETNAIEAYEKPFGAEVLSDEHLGIPTATEEEAKPAETEAPSDAE